MTDTATEAFIMEISNKVANAKLAINSHLAGVSTINILSKFERSAIKFIVYQISVQLAYDVISFYCIPFQIDPYISIVHFIWAQELKPKGVLNNRNSLHFVLYIEFPLSFRLQNNT